MTSTKCEKLEETPKRKPNSRPPIMHVYPTKSCYITTKPNELRGDKWRINTILLWLPLKCQRHCDGKSKKLFDVAVLGLLKLSSGRQPNKPRRNTTHNVGKHSTKPTHWLMQTYVPCCKQACEQCMLCGMRDMHL